MSTTTSIRREDSPHTPWWVVLIEGIAAIIVGIFAAGQPCRHHIIPGPIPGILLVFYGDHRHRHHFRRPSRLGLEAVFGHHRYPCRAVHHPEPVVERLPGTHHPGLAAGLRRDLHRHQLAVPRLPGRRLGSGHPGRFEHPLRLPPAQPPDHGRAGDPVCIWHPGRGIWHRRIFHCLPHPLGRESSQGTSCSGRRGSESSSSQSTVRTACGCPGKSCSPGAGYTRPCRAASSG